MGQGCLCAKFAEFPWVLPVFLHEFNLGAVLGRNFTGNTVGNELPGTSACRRRSRELVHVKFFRSSPAVLLPRAAFRAMMG